VFDLLVMVDWSSASTPARGRDSIWSAALDVASGQVDGPHNHPTRADAFAHLLEVLGRARGRRVLVGCDFPYGYPEGTALAWGVAPSWRGVWALLDELVHDDERNRNDRFEVAAELNRRVGPGPGPFWGCPPAQAGPYLSTRKAPGFPHRGARVVLAEYRRTEQAMRDTRRRVFSEWQLYGAGSVGGQALVGIPWLRRLVTAPELAGRSVVWPFTTGLVSDPTAGRDDAIVHAEIWPGIVELDGSLHPVRDAAQVLGLCRHLAELDRAGHLGDLFAPPVPEGHVAAVVREEGWILGA
jgi:precorrin-8X/cobalt-precorrin-8 methylmutase